MLSMTGKVQSWVHSPVLTSGIHCTLKPQGAAALAHACASAVRELYPPKALSLYWVNLDRLPRADPDWWIISGSPGRLCLQQGTPWGTWPLPCSHKPSFSWNESEMPWKSSKIGLVEYNEELAAYFFDFLFVCLVGLGWGGRWWSTKILSIFLANQDLLGLGAEKACEVGEVGLLKLFCSCCFRGLGAGFHLPGPIVNE